MKQVLLVSLLFLLVACGQEAAPPPPTEPTTAATTPPEPTAEPSPTPEPTATEEPAEAALPEGWERYPVEGGRITLDLPDAFYVFQEGDLDEEEMLEAMGEAAPALAEQLDLETLMQQGIKLYAMDVDALKANPDAYPVTLNVVINETGEVPLDLLLQGTASQMEQFGAQNMAEPREITVNGQEMGLLEYDFTYTFPEGDRPARLRQAFFIVDGLLHVITFTYPVEADEATLETIEAITQQIQVIEE